MNDQPTPPTPEEQSSRPWIRATIWLPILAVMFFSTYLGSLEVVSWYDHVPVIKFDWEDHIPFLAWTIVPYWSIDLLYGISLYLCRNKHELNRHAYRLITAQAIAIPIFLIWPLKLTSTIPPDVAPFEFFFGALEDLITKPFNLAPSLHIALLVILWERYSKHIPSFLRWPMHIWALLIGISVLTANQHHFFDVPTGAALGLFCLWCWPIQTTDPTKSNQIRQSNQSQPRSPLAFFQPTTNPRRLTLASLYLATGLILTGLGWTLWGTALWLLWPAMSLILVSSYYLFLGPNGFQKSNSGNISLANRWLLFPYLQGAKLNSFLWTRNQSPSNTVAHQVSISRMPTPNDLKKLASTPNLTVIDLTAEFQRPKAPSGSTIDWHSFPCLDLVPANPITLKAAAELIQLKHTQNHPVLVCCALGVSRSASTILTWLVAFNHSENQDAALQTLRAARPQIKLSPAQLQTVQAAIDLITQPQTSTAPNHQ